MNDLTFVPIVRPRADIVCNLCALFIIDWNHHTINAHNVQRHSLMLNFLCVGALSAHTLFHIFLFISFALLLFTDVDFSSFELNTDLNFRIESTLTWMQVEPNQKWPNQQCYYLFRKLFLNENRFNIGIDSTDRPRRRTLYSTVVMYSISENKAHYKWFSLFLRFLRALFVFIIKSFI